MSLFKSAQGIFVFLSLIFIMVTSISWIVFARLTMARIEREIEAAGLPRPAQWDGLGYRVLWYLHAIIFPVGIWNRPDDPLIDVSLVRRYATRKDIIRGWIFFVANSTLLFLLLIFVLFFNK
jgi:hypothetical protein